MVQKIHDDDPDYMMIHIKMVKIHDDDTKTPAGREYNSLCKSLPKSFLHPLSFPINTIA